MPQPLKKCTICDLPLAAFQNVHLSCCADAYYHIACANGQHKCNKCGYIFNDELKKAMKDIWQRTFDEEFEIWKKQEAKKETGRAQVQAAIDQIIVPDFIRRILSGDT